MRNALLLLTPLGLASCATVPVGPPTGNGLTYARIGENVNVGGPRVTALKVLDDSRCPVDVQCVWAGEVRLSVRITTGAGTATREVVSGTPLAVADGTLSLADVQPQRWTDAIFAPSQYRFGFRFDGGL